MSTVTILGRANCGACIFTKRALELARVSYEILDVDESGPAAALAEQIAAQLGTARLPIVMCADGTRWAGLQMHRIAQIVRTE